jgi:hypothetical protein
MAASQVLSSQFRGFGAKHMADHRSQSRTRVKMDSHPETAKTMPVDSGSGLPKAPKVHPHKRHAHSIPRRAR